MDLEEVWRIREEEVYPRLFGPVSRGIFTLDQSVFERFGEVQVDPRWHTYGVFEYGPHGGRESWVYVTSAHSNPWEVEPQDYDPEGDSGAGIEFVLETEAQGDWAIVLLRNMLAFDLVLASGQMGNRPTLGLHDRVPIRAPLDGRDETTLTSLMIIRPTGFEAEFSLPSGRGGFMEFVGITEDEASFARAEGGGSLIERLEAAGAAPVTRLARASVV